MNFFSLFCYYRRGSLAFETGKLVQIKPECLNRPGQLDPLADRQRLDQERAPTQSVSLLHVTAASRRTQDDYGQQAKRRFLLEPAQHLQSGAHWQLQVQEN